MTKHPEQISLWHLNQPGSLSPSPKEKLKLVSFGFYSQIFLKSIYKLPF